MKYVFFNIHTNITTMSSNIMSLSINYVVYYSNTCWLNCCDKLIKLIRYHVLTVCGGATLRDFRNRLVKFCHELFAFPGSLCSLSGPPAGWWWSLVSTIPELCELSGIVSSQGYGAKPGGNDI